nr:hypothetical protein [Listeria goaensis]
MTKKLNEANSIYIDEMEVI